MYVVFFLLQKSVINKFMRQVDFIYILFLNREKVSWARERACVLLWFSWNDDGNENLNEMLLNEQSP